MLVKTAPGAAAADVARAIEAQVSDVDAVTTDEWRVAQECYWMFGTGAGITVLIAAALGLLVGIVVVAQTIYAATVDHIREYGTLKAMGATNAYLLRVIVTQAIISALIGGVLGIGIGLTAAHGSQSGTTAIIVPAAAGRGAVGAHGLHVRPRVARLDQQSRPARSGDGVQGLKAYSYPRPRRGRWQVRGKS